MVDVIALPPLAGLPDLHLADPATLPADATVALTADALDVLSALGPPAWGIFDPQTGAPVVVADTVTEVGYSKASGISNYPIEDGGFSAYDKQAAPYEARVRLASGGSPDVRQALLESVEAIEDDLNTYSIVTSDRVYPNANLTRFEYRRANADGGASLLSVEVGVQEVRLLSAVAGSNTADPASANPVDGGTVQPVDPTAAQTTTALPFFASGVALPPTLGGKGF